MGAHAAILFVHLLHRRHAGRFRTYFIFSYEMTMPLSLPMLNFAHESRQRLPQCHGSGPQAGIGVRETINTYK